MELNLSTSNSNLSILELAQKGVGLINPAALLWTMIIAMAFVIILFFLKRINSRIKYLAFFFYFLLLFRFMLFGNLASWGLYYAILDADEIGFRQVDTISNEIRKQLRKPAITKFLAVGSSQTVRLYKTYAEQNNDFETFGVAGMSTLDYMLYKDYIAAYQPEYVVLFLSEFDLAKMPNRGALKISPPPHLYWPRLYTNLRLNLEPDDYRSAVKEMLIGEVFSEYKYAFIFRGLIDKLLGKNKAVGKEQVTKKSAEEWRESQLKSITALNPDALNVSVAFLDDFVSFCNTENITVVITEGQYHPAGYTGINISLNNTVRQRLGEVESRHDNVLFYTRSELLQFSENDYQDAVHVYPEVGYVFAERLRELITADSMPAG